MKSRSLIELEALPFIEGFERPVLCAGTLPALRAVGEKSPPEIDPADFHRVTITRTVATVPAYDSAVPVVVCKPMGSAAKKRAALLHIHGGGFILGDAQSEADWSAWLAANLDCVVVAPDYRLAPEHAHPVPVTDCYVALQWLTEHADTLGIDLDRVAVFGGSAGGGLAAAVALLARDRSGPRICFQCLLYPMLDDRTGSTVDVGAFVGEYIWTREDNVFGWTSLLGREPGRGDVSPYAAPARAGDLTGLPSTYIWVGALDLFVEESVLYARRLLAAGVPTELHVYPGVTHGNVLVGTAPSTVVCRQGVLRCLAGALG
jgi:acetyl esterase/lipase